MAEMEVSDKDEIELDAILHQLKMYSKDCVQNFVKKGDEVRKLARLLNAIRKIAC